MHFSSIHHFDNGVAFLEKKFNVKLFIENPMILSIICDLEMMVL